MAAGHVLKAAALQGLVRETAAEAERERRLPARVAEAMARAGLYMVAAPRSVGGGETDPVTQIRVIETIAEADGAAGWNLMIGIEAGGMAAAALPIETAQQVFEDPLTIVAGALNPKGRARPVEGGYMVTGQWPFASGCHNASWFHGQCIVTRDDGEFARGPDGNVVLREVLVPRGQFTIVDTWHTSGLRGSGSHDVAVNAIFVPHHFTTGVGSDGLRHNGPLFRLPVYSRLAYNKVGVSTGIARNAIDTFVLLAKQKVPRGSRNSLRERATAQLALAEAEATLRSARAWVFEVVGELWDATVAEREVTPEHRALVQLACSNAARASARAVELVCEAAGTSANEAGTVLERCRRDVHVVPQQIMASGQWIESAGRVLLGLPSNSPIL